MVENMIKTKTPEQIHYAIAQKLVKGASYIDSLVEYAKENDMEIESLADIIKRSSAIKEKIRSEAIKMKMVKNEHYDITEHCE